jgi:uncharacterized protein (DUF2141 family)
MKRLLLLTCTIVLFVTQMHAENGTLIVRFENLKSNDGKVMVALFDGKENFSKQEATQTVTLSIANYSAVWNLESLPEGKYIIIAYHDENENQKIDLGIMGIPVEGYAFSNNRVAEMGPPNPDDMLFEVKGNQETIHELTMVYFDFSLFQNK